jgi:hypothetical protein
MRRRCRPLTFGALVAAAVVFAGCDRPDTLLLCHNANCVEPPDPSKDDTLDAMRASLALELDGRPVIDGMEVDLFWQGGAERCLFAHDLKDLDSASPAATAADELAAYFARAGPLSWSDQSFVVMIEMKGHVGAAKSDAHTPAQRDAHAACALDVFETLDAAALAEDRDVAVVFTSFDPALLAALAREPRWPAPGGSYATVRLGATIGIPTPLDSQTRPLDEFSDIDLVEVHPHWMTDGQYEGYASAGYDLAFWMFSATVETFDAIDRYEPSMVVTSEARLLRRWLED